MEGKIRRSISIEQLIWWWFPPSSALTAKFTGKFWASKKYRLLTSCMTLCVYTRQLIRELHALLSAAMEACRIPCSITYLFILSDLWFFYDRRNAISESLITHLCYGQALTYCGALQITASYLQQKRSKFKFKYQCICGNNSIARQILSAPHQSTGNLTDAW